MRTRLAFAIPVIALVAAFGIGLLAAWEIAGIGLESGLPPSITRFRGSDRARYAIHATLARALGRVRPELAAIQWVRAAAHVRSDRDVEAVAAGLSATVARGGPDPVASFVCPRLGGVNATQQALMERARLRCTESLRSQVQSSK